MVERAISRQSKEQTALPLESQGSRSKKSGEWKGADKNAVSFDLDITGFNTYKKEKNFSSKERTPAGFFRS